MTLAPFKQSTTDTAILNDFEIPCDGPRVWPERIPDHDAPARWIGVKNCGHARLLCDGCKDFYLRLMARWPSFTCDDCKVKSTSKFITFEPLKS